MEFQKEYKDLCEEGLIPARVTVVHKERYEVASEKGNTFAVLKRGEYQGKDMAEEFPAVGDYVSLRYEEAGDSLIVKTLPRTSKFSRSNFSGHAAGYVKTVLEQTVAANFDYVFLLSSLNHDFSVSRMERYLAMAHHSGAQPVIVLTKADVAVDAADKMLSARTIAGQTPIHMISAHTGEGLSALSSYFAKGKTIVFLGSSGVGKSSLVNALVGEEVMAVNDIREDDSKGRHTTTHRQMIFLPGGAVVIDTPGLRELGVVWEAEEGIAETFADVEDFLDRCRFSDCTHQNEPGCAVREAVEQGVLSKERMERYLRLKRETRFNARRAKPANCVSGKKPRSKTWIADE
jgi:ribosome biogenesis GTPase / thiamine phosphate phosphatase